MGTLDVEREEIMMFGVSVYGGKVPNYTRDVYSCPVLPCAAGIDTV